MKGFLFQYPAFLFGLMALGIPIVIHLINRNVPRRLVFSSIRFIQKAQSLKTGKKYIRDWWVLLARLLILSLLVLLFASPIIAIERILKSAENEEILLFYDLSVSMNTEEFNQFVKIQTQKILGDHKNAQFALIASSNKIEKRISFDSTKEEILRSVQELNPTLVEGNHEIALEAMRNFFSDTVGVKRKIYIFSDLQRQDWSASRLPHLALHAQVNFVKPSQSDAPNMAISQVFTELYSKNDIRRLRATIEVHNYSLKPTQAELALTIGDTTESKDIELRGDYSEKFIIDLENPSSNMMHAEIKVDEAFILDNNYYSWIGPQAPIKIGIMADIEADTHKSVEVFFLRNALSVSLPGGQVFDTNVISPDYVWNSSLVEFQCLFILDAIAGYTEPELEALGGYLSAGGTVVYIAGRETATNIVKLNQSNISNIRFQGYYGEINQLRWNSITSLYAGSPIVSLFEKERGDLFQFPIYKFAKLSPSANSTVLLTVGDRYPFLIQEKTDQGELFIFTTSLGSNWSEFSTSLSFLPLIHQIVEYSSSGSRRGIIELTIGEDPLAKFEEAGLSADEQIPLEQGVYVVQGTPLEINITRAESDFRSVEKYDILARLTSGPGSNDPTLNQPKSGGTSIRSLKKPLAWLLVAFFALELVIANRTKKGKLEL